MKTNTKKNWVPLIICLIVLLLKSSLSHSQIDSSKGTVPCFTLKNALIVKAERDYLKNNILPLTQDSIQTLIYINKSQDTIIKNDSNVIHRFHLNERDYEEIISNQNIQVNIYKDLYKKEKKYKYIGYGVGILAILTSLWIVK